MRRLRLINSLRVGLISKAKTSPPNMPYLSQIHSFFSSGWYFSMSSWSSRTRYFVSMFVMSSQQRFRVSSMVRSSSLSCLRELILEDICELQKLQISLIERILADNRNETSQFSPLRISSIHLIADFLMIIPRSLLTNTGPHQPG